MSFARVIMHGNLTRDPELRNTTTGKAVATFGVAVNEMRKEGATSFFDCECWEKSAEFVAQHFHKGDPIIIEGGLRQETWSDKESGAKRSKVVVAVNKMHFCGAKKEGGSPGRPTAEQLGRVKAEAAKFNPDDDESLPF